MNTSEPPWHGEVERALVLRALEELGEPTQDLYLEHSHDALTLGTGDGVLLRTVTLPCRTVFRLKTDRHKHLGLRYYAVLPSAERPLFYRAFLEQEESFLVMRLRYGMICVGEKAMVPSRLDLEKRETHPTQIIRTLFNSPHNFRIDMNPTALSELVQTIRPLQNNDAILVQWDRRSVRLSGLVKTLDAESRLQVDPRILALDGLCRKKTLFPGSVVINMQKRNAAKVDGERLAQALAWLGDSKEAMVYAGHDPCALVLRRGDDIARHALLMMQRFLPEEVTYLDTQGA